MMDEEWNDPIPYADGKPELIPFPVSSLPPVLREMAEAVAEWVQIDVAMAAAVELAVAATAVQGKVYIEPKGDGWRLPLNIYMAVVASSGERKTAMEMLKQPIMDYQKRYNVELEPQVREYQRKQKIVEMQIAELTKKASRPSKNGKGMTTEQAIAEIGKLDAELSEMQVNPVTPMNIVYNDCTPEALAYALHEHGERGAVFSDEGGIFETLAGRYSNKGQANIDIFLKAYDGTSYEVERIGRQSFTLHNPLLTICLMLQPSVLDGVTANSNFVGRGLLARFLVAFPKSMVGKQRYRTEPVPDDYIEQYNRVISGLMGISGQTVLTLDADADRQAENYFYMLQESLKSPEELHDEGALQSFGAKLFGDCMRIAGLIHCVSCVWNCVDVSQPVNQETVNCAIEITKYFYHTGKMTFGGGGSELERNGQYLLDVLIRKRDRTGESIFSRSKIDAMININRNSQRWGNRETGLSATLDDLINRNYIRQYGRGYELSPFALQMDSNREGIDLHEGDR